MQLDHLGIIGNCQFSALCANDGDIVWCCLPRFDSEPLFSSLLDSNRGGRFLVGPADGGVGTQRYVDNTNVLETTFVRPDGSFRVVDFAPRFAQYDRFFRPTMIVRVVEPLEGTPRVRVVCEPKLGWSGEPPVRTHGSNHVRFEGFESQVRLTTDIPISYLGGRASALTERRHLVLTWGAPVEESLPSLASRFREQTMAYWRRWVKHCRVPPLFQAEVIRSALALKLHCFEDTGAIVAATTTSIPEAPGSGRTWDYRYCWLRDAYYVLDALRLLGHFEERERFVQFLLEIVAAKPSLDLAPLYRVDGASDLAEREEPGWAGYAGHGPVRVGNAAALHQQNDIFGEMVLALAPVFLDDRFREEQSKEALGLVEALARKAIAVAGQPDAGIWEYRTAWTPQTFSSVMCWAGADRMAKVAERHAPDRAAGYRAAAARIREEVLARAWDATRPSLVSTYGGKDLDAALLQLAPLRFLAPGDDRLRATIDAVRKELATEEWLFRYRADDGFGAPTVAFVICTFWLVEALAATGRLEEARLAFERARSALSPLGLLSEDYDTANRRMWGNFPQAYSHVGLIHAAFVASPRWEDIL